MTVTGLTPPGPAGPGGTPGTRGAARRPAIAGYSDLTGSIASQGTPAPVSCASRCRTVCDLPAPVAPVTNAWRFRVASGTRNSPTGRSSRSRIAPRLTDAVVSTVSLVRSKGAASVIRSPGTSRRGRPVSAASTPAVAGKGARAPVPGSVTVAASASASGCGARPLTSR
jgi:hypothetical protein